MTKEPAATVCAAFQATAAARGDEVALRTKGGAIEITWREYAEQVRRIAAGLHKLGLRRGDTIALMLTNRPEFHLIDAAAMHLGAVPFSIYNTSSSEQAKFVLRDSGAKIGVVEPSFRDRMSTEHVIEVDLLDELEDDPDFDFDAAWRALEPDDLLTLIYTSGTTGDPKGVQLTHQSMLSRWTPTTGAPLPARRQRRLLPADGPHRRAQLLALLPDAVRLHGHVLPGRARGRQLLPRGPAVVVLRRAADLREAQGRDRGRRAKR